MRQGNSTITLVSRGRQPGQRVRRELVDRTLTALHFLEQQGLITMVYELHALCRTSDLHLSAAYGSKLLEEGLLESYTYHGGTATMDPQVRAIVLAAVVAPSANRVKIARRAADIIQR